MVAALGVAEAALVGNRVPIGVGLGLVGAVNALVLGEPGLVVGGRRARAAADVEGGRQSQCAEAGQDEGQVLASHAVRTESESA